MSIAPAPRQFWNNGQPPVAFYEGSGYMFSNFSAFSITMKVGSAELDWMTAEHAYQAHKFSGSWEIPDKIFHARSAYDAKRIAREHATEVRPDWDAVKLAAMEEILRCKIRQHPYVRQKLIGTGARVLVEDSPTDSFWGRGPEWQGRNELGKLWMRLRKELNDDVFE